MSDVHIDLGPRSYDVTIGTGLLEKLGNHLPEGGEVVVITDNNVDPIYGDRVENAITPRAGWRIVVPAGEATKTIEVAERILEDLAGARVRRTDLVLTVGGGMVSDLGGFVASIYQRGIPLVHFPTSLLGQVDAAIGGKTGVNLSEGKNLCGTFYHPRAVVADTETLATLPDREFVSGMAEVAKYGFISSPEMLDEIEGGLERIKARESELMEKIVTRCVETKAEIVSRDELDDRDERIFLNYGHTLGHALEAWGGYEEWSHGEAISIGMCFAAAVGVEMGLLDSASLDRHLKVLDVIGLPTKAAFDAEELMHRVEIDKKNRGGTQRWVLLETIGRPVVRDDVDEKVIRKALEIVKSP
jgi:3-dehydroquinate synthase